MITAGFNCSFTAAQIISATLSHRVRAPPHKITSFGSICKPVMILAGTLIVAFIPLLLPSEYTEFILNLVLLNSCFDTQDT